MGQVQTTGLKLPVGYTSGMNNSLKPLNVQRSAAIAALFFCFSYPVSGVAKTTKAETAKTVTPPIMTVNYAMELYAEPVRAKLKPLFAAANITYPPKAMTWIALKQEKMLYLFAKDNDGTMKQILRYPIIGASGVAGPKLKEGDKQVPEGFYKISGFRPNVIAHLGLDVDYPNAEDRNHAKTEGRKNLGCDILIHGSKWSTGCLAMGNEPIEEMFVLTHDSGCDTIRLIFAPCNLVKQRPDINLNRQPKWVPNLYKRLTDELKTYRFNET